MLIQKSIIFLLLGRLIDDLNFLLKIYIHRRGTLFYFILYLALLVEGRASSISTLSIRTERLWLRALNESDGIKNHHFRCCIALCHLLFCSSLSTASVINTQASLPTIGAEKKTSEARSPLQIRFIKNKQNVQQKDCYVRAFILIRI